MEMRPSSRVNSANGETDIIHFGSNETRIEVSLYTTALQGDSPQ